MTNETTSEAAVAERCVVVPRVDITQSEHEVVLHADLPGVTAASLDVSLEKDTLTIRGSVESVEPEGYRLHYRDVRAECFERSFRLSSDLDRDRIEASFAKGVLRLTIPRRNPTRTIAIQTA